MHLTWHDHGEQLQSKIAKRLGVLKRIKHLLPVDARRIYVSKMVVSILEYSSIVWGDKNNKVLMDSIQVLQNKAAKLVLDRATNSSSTQALLDLNWMNLSTKRLMQRCCVLHNFNMTVKETVWLLETQTIAAITPAPRKLLDLLDQTRTGVYSDPLINSALTDWNSLPEDMRCLPYNAFKISLLKHFKSQ